MTSSTNPTETISDEAVGAAARVLADRAGGWSPPGWWHERTARAALAAALPSLRAQIETELLNEENIARVLWESAGIAPWRQLSEEGREQYRESARRFRAALVKGGRS